MVTMMNIAHELDRIEEAARQLRAGADGLPERYLIEISHDTPPHEQMLGHPLFVNGVADILEHHAALCRATGCSPSVSARSVADVILGANT